MFQIEARVYSMVSEVPGATKKWGHDVTEIELGFLINGKKVNYTGFKTLYNQLFGKDVPLVIFIMKNAKNLKQHI